MSDPGDRLSRQTLRALAAVMENPSEPFYGLEIARAADLRSGTMYPILRRLEGLGWLSSEWERVDPAIEKRPRRRLYRVTGVGAQAADDALRAARSEVECRPRRPKLGVEGAPEPA